MVKQVESGASSHNGMTKTMPIPNVGVTSEYIGRAAAGSWANFETYILQNRAYSMLEVLSKAGHPSRPSLNELLSTSALAAKLGPTSNAYRWIRQFNSRSLLTIARILTNRREHPSDLYHAVTLFKTVFRIWGARAYSERDKLFLIEALSELGFMKDIDRYIRLLKLRGHAPFRGLLEANHIGRRIIDQGLDVGSHELEYWIASINRVMCSVGDEPLSFRDGPESFFDRILCEPTSHVFDGPKVTVIVPTFGADSRFDTALNSLVNQSWTNLEIVVADDCTPGGIPSHVAKWAEIDDRVIVIRMPENGGTYRARNYVVKNIASGKYVTVHDDDDWSHPRKIQRQVESLENSGGPANMSMLSRATSNLIFTRINNNPDFVQRNYSSLMIRRDIMMSELGYWDEVNRSGDAEFVDRIERWAGEQVPGIGTVPLSFLRVRESSLTSGEIVRGYIDTRRRWYQMASRQYLDSIDATKEKAFFRSKSHASDDRPYAAPFDLIRSRGGQSGALRVDVVYVTDGRFPGGNSSAAATEIAVLADAGMSVGFLQMDSPLNGISSKIHPSILSATSRENVFVLSRLDEVEAQTTILRHPSVLQFAPRLRCAVETRGTLAVIANHQASDGAGGGAVYDPAEVVDVASAVFGTRPVLFAESSVTEASLRGLVDPRFISPDLWPPTLKFRTPEHRATNSHEGKPVVGRHGRDHRLKWPGKRESLFDAYPVDGTMDVRILGGAAEAEHIAGFSLQDSWTVYPYGSQDVMEFLSELDFWVYAHSDRLRESFGMAAAEAMAAGVVTILPPYMKETFGDGAVYATTPNIKRAVSELYSDRTAYADQSQKGVEYVANHFGEGALLARVRRLMPVDRSQQLSFGL